MNEVVINDKIITWQMEINDKGKALAIRTATSGIYCIPS